MTAATQMHAHDRLFIGGDWVAPSSDETVEVVNPATEEAIGHVPAGTARDADRAVAAARAAFPSWSAAPLEVRQEALRAIRAGLEARADDLTELITLELGAPLRMSRLVQVGMPLATFSSCVSLVEEVPWRTEIGNSVVVREPIGVVAGITPWNYPLHQIAAKAAAALVAGCTVVIKPSEVTPFNAFVLAEVIAAAGLPPGVFNLVTGTGPDVGEPLAAHRDVDLVSFTGSTRVGRRISELAAATVKPISLELGGKSANVILDDADLTKAVPDGIAKCYANSGQTCSALTRMLVPRNRVAEVEQIAAATVERIVVGDPFDPATRLGPLVSAAQREVVHAYIAKGIAEGARLVTGGTEAPEGLDRGYYARPTVFSHVSSQMTIAQEEIFGPVLAILPYEDEEDAVRIANDSDYGLAGGVWSADTDRAVAVASRLRTGQVEINGAAFNPVAPFGGVKQSGHGRELGPWGIAEFTTVKSIQR